MNVFNNFIFNIKEKINYIIGENEKFEIIFVMSDLVISTDSFFSVFLLALYKNLEYGNIKFAENKDQIQFLFEDETKPNKIFIPVVNSKESIIINKSDLKYYWEKLFGVYQTHLFYFDDCFDKSTKNVCFKSLKSK